MGWGGLGGPFSRISPGLETRGVDGRLRMWYIRCLAAGREGFGSGETHVGLFTWDCTIDSCRAVSREWMTFTHS